MQCGVNCGFWHFNLKFPMGIGAICLKYMLPIDNAWDKCFAVTGKGRPEKQAASIRANSWPGSIRGWGPITREIEGEKVKPI
jgi:hypothetical protein